MNAHYHHAFVAALKTGSILLALTCGSCSEAAPSEQPEIRRPVTALELESSTPSIGGNTMGVVQPYREQAIGFDVGGRVLSVEDIGSEVRGPTLDNDGRVMVGKEGEVIASIDAARYQQALRQAQLSLASARKGLEAREIQAQVAKTSDLQQAEANARMAEQELASAEAAEKQASAQLERTKQEFATGIAAGSKMEADQASANRAKASLESARQAVRARESALLSTQSQAKLAQAQVEQTKAEIAELEQRVATAQRDLDDCTLRAPFSGRITKVHVGRGGTVQQGGAVVTLTAMNPMQISVTVSAEQSRQLVQGAKVALHPREIARYTDAPALYGSVFGKAEVADAATRTFRVDLIVRNLRRSRTPREIDGKPIYAVDDLMPVMRENPNSRGPLFVGADCIETIDNKTFVYLLPELRAFHPSAFDLDRILRPKRIEVQLRAERLTFINFKFVRIEDQDGLTEGGMLIRSPRPEHTAGVTLERYDWLLRPGDLTPVSLTADAHPEGIYVPVDAISSSNDQQHVFVIDGDRARRVPVTPYEGAANLRRIEGPGIQPGTKIVQQGAHYVSDGDLLRVVDQVF